VKDWVIDPVGGVTSPTGFVAAAVASGLKKESALDLALLYAQQECAAAAVFTQNQVVAAPVIIDRQTLQANNAQLRAVVANAGNANACTGQPGLLSARQMQQLTASSLDCRPDQVLVLSTGVIGMQLPMDKIRYAITQAAAQLSPDGGQAAAQAIMTTDTRPKHLALQLDLPGGKVTLGGMAKGAGMIHPDMATMLSVITTDASVSPGLLDRFLKKAADNSFNRISIDGDTSTNDTVLLLANGASRATVADRQSATQFQQGLTYLCTQLAKMIVRDGEGATKFVELRVQGCRTEADAHAIAQTIATSPLVKTAFAGSDANWGRILAAAGRAGVAFDPSQVSLWVGAAHPTELQLVAVGTPTDYREADAAAIFSQAEFSVQLELGEGDAMTTMWTTDLTHEYITINADYRT
jgi:glutamate N-acetyltransferase/amino-acid N-acetyltransferase